MTEKPESLSRYIWPAIAVSGLSVLVISCGVRVAEFGFTPEAAVDWLKDFYNAVLPIIDLPLGGSVAPSIVTALLQTSGL